MPKIKPSGRLALRLEGDFWNAYWAQPDTMQDALLLGSIRYNVVSASPRLEQAFMQIMKDAITLIFAEEGLGKVEWPPPHPAPESERTN